ncbi:helix-turn-helix domain-containing protein [Cellulophaga sp. F20128]|uniref:helix-turn-helix domain-containing protein n=1 Tax=Cellulophaga sp. F20128 TaxID=2926413 RepID=UPI001FF30D1B|nr:helix-turn-helix domain-containing protein [Cellulophaga sp. F20128]MCK0158200.1 helix-turn-helix domain-containing protein [Cellulophaga sp. F20128]
MELLFLLNIILGFVFGALLVFKATLTSKTNKYLGYAVWVISFIMLNGLLKEMGFYDEYDLLTIFYDIEWIFLFPVFIFVYIIKATKHNLSKTKETKFLYLPFIFSIALNLFNNLERDFELFSLKNPIAVYIKASLFSIENSFVYMFNFLMLIWLFFILKNDKNQIRITWLWRLWAVIFVLVVLWILLDFVEHYSQGNDSSVYINILFTGLSFFLYWISYNAIYKSRLYAEAEEITKLLNVQNLVITNTSNPVSKNPHFLKFENLFKEGHIYRDPNITRESVAEKLEISAGYLSQLINAHIDENFSGYVNQFRVNEVKTMLLDKTFDKYNIESIGLEAGFSSKTTFYNVFKKITGMTPKEFKNQQE